MLSQLPTTERRRLRLHRAARRALEIWGRVWPLLAMLAMSGACWWFGWSIMARFSR